MVVRGAMRVLMVMTGPRVGGLQFSCVPYGAALKLKGHEVRALLIHNSPYVESLRACGVPTDLTRWPRKPFPFDRLQARDIARVAAGFTPDVALTFASKGLSPTLSALKGKLPIITRCGATKAKTISGLLGADAIIASSAEMKSRIVATGYDDGRVYVLPNFIEDPGPPPRKALEQAVVVASLGRLVHRKGFDILIRAAGILKAEGQPLAVRIAGDGPERAALRALAADLDVTLDLTGWVNGGEKREFLARADIFVCPSRYEPFGYVNVEAMSQGLPVVATETTGPRAIFAGSDAATLVPVEDPKAMANALKPLLTDHARRSAMGTAARQHFVNTFSLSAGAETLDRILMQVAGGTK